METKIKMWKDIIAPSVGYLFVVLICIMSGNFIHRPLSFYDFFIITPEQFLFWLLLVPYFLNRIIMFELPYKSVSKEISNTDKALKENKEQTDERIDKEINCTNKVLQEDKKQTDGESNKKPVRYNIHNVDEDWIDLSKNLPLLVLGFNIFVYGFLIFFLKSNGFLSSDYSIIDWRKLLSLFISALPFMLITTISYRKWKNNKTKEMFNFRNYIFFPALSTCLISFIVGYTKLESISSSLYTSTSIVLYYGISQFDKIKIWKWKILPVLDIVISIITIGFYLWLFFISLPLKKEDVAVNREIALSLFLTFLMITLMMGIAETWWFLRNDNNVYKYDENTKKFYKDTLTWVTILITLLFPWIIFNPQTNSFSYIILVFTLFFFITFFLLEKDLKRKPKLQKGLKFSLGIFLPIICVLSLHKDVSLNIPIAKNDLLNLGVGFTSLLLGIFINSEKYFPNLQENQAISINYKGHIFISCGVILCGITLITSPFKEILSKETVQKFNGLSTFYLYIVAILIVYLGYQNLKKRLLNHNNQT